MKFTIASRGYLDFEIGVGNCFFFFSGCKEHCPAEISKFRFPNFHVISTDSTKSSTKLNKKILQRKKEQVV